MRKKTRVSVFPVQTYNRRLIEEIKIEFTFTITAPSADNELHLFFSASGWTPCSWKSKLSGLGGAAKTGWLGFQFPPSSQPGWRKCRGLKVKASAYMQPSHYHLLGWDAKVSVWKVQGDGEGCFWLINYGELNFLFDLSSYEAWFVLVFVH